MSGHESSMSEHAQHGEENVGRNEYSTSFIRKIISRVLDIGLERS